MRLLPLLFIVLLSGAAFATPLDDFLGNMFDFGRLNAITGMATEPSNETQTCVPEGGSLGAVYPNNNLICCSGLKVVGTTSFAEPSCTPDGSCREGKCTCVVGNRGYCSYCGNGVCKYPENHCNCPEDCHASYYPSCGSFSADPNCTCSSGQTRIKTTGRCGLDAWKCVSSVPVEITNQTKCITDSDCENNYSCYYSLFCSMTLFGANCGEPEGDSRCHKNCQSNADCPSEEPYCKSFTVWSGDAGSQIRICTRNQTEDQTRECSDSDNGLNYYVKGSVWKCSCSSGPSGATSCGCTIPKSDTCNYCTGLCQPGAPCNSTCFAVVEYYCSGDNIANTTFNCPGGCRDGACLNESTTTGGEAPRTLPATATPTVNVQKIFNNIITAIRDFFRIEI